MAKDTDKRWKGILQDWPTVSEMDTVDIEYKALTQQQVAILLAAITPYRWKTRWINLGISKDELEGLISEIELRLMESAEMSMDYEALAAAIKTGMYDMVNDVAKQIVSGRTTNISVDDDGAVSDPSDALPSDDLPEDDPETVGDESLEALAGGASAMRLGLNLIWSQLSTWYVGSITASQSKARLKQIYILEPNETDALVDAYYNARTATQPYVTSFATTLDSYFFCKGQTLQILARWIYDLQTANLQDMSGLMANAMTQEQLNVWFASGTQTPSTDYVDYSCTKTPSETITVPLDSNVFYSGVQTWKINHRIRWTVTGYQTDPQGNIIDFWWNRSAAGVLTFKSNDVMVRIGSTEMVEGDATPNEVPYNTGHAYTWTGILSLGGIMSIRVNRGTGIDTGTNYTWQVLVEDLGEVIT